MFNWLHRNGEGNEKEQEKKKKKLEMKIFFHMLFGCEEEKKRKEV